jgi:hypothetical protein
VVVIVVGVGIVCNGMMMRKRRNGVGMYGYMRRVSVNVREVGRCRELLNRIEKV